MSNLLTKKIKYENCFYYLFNIISLILSIIIYINDDFTGIRLLNNNIIGLILIIISIILIILKTVLLIFKKNSKIERILFFIIILLLIILLIDKFILGIVRSFVEANNLDHRPTKYDPFSVRLAYIIIKNYKTILNGIWTTLWLSLLGTIVGLIISLLFVCIKNLEVNFKEKEIITFLKKTAQKFVDIYVTVFRGTPMMVQAIIIYYFLPGVLASIFNVDIQVLNNFFSALVAGFITVTLNTTAYLTEVLRGGIDSINKGQMEAARSLGMSRRKAMQYIVLPQAIKNSLPSICNEFIINIKDTSVLSVISVMDLFFIIDAINKKNASQDGIFIAAIIYLALTFGISKLLSYIEKKMNIVSKPLPSCN